MKSVPSLLTFGSDRVVTAAHVNRLLKAVGCRHLVACDGEPGAPYFWHIFDEHCPGDPRAEGTE